VAAEFDRDPFLMFELRGLSKRELQDELAKSPLGQALVSQLAAQDVLVEPSASYYTALQAETVSREMDIKTFWTGEKKLPNEMEPPSLFGVPALLIKKQGDFPPFWNKDQSFIEIMEDFYSRVKGKNKKIL
jgi:uncharacterized Zn finger protein